MIDVNVNYNNVLIIRVLFYKKKTSFYCNNENEPSHTHTHKKNYCKNKCS